MQVLQRPGKREGLGRRVRGTARPDRRSARHAAVMSVNRNAARVRATAAEVVDAVVTGGRSLDASIRQHDEKVAEGDRALFRNLCFGSIRHHWQLAEWASRLVDRPLKKRDSVITALLHVGLFQLSGTRIPDHAVVSQTVEAARLLRRPKLAPLLNAVLRRFIRENMAEQAATSPASTHNHPEWMIDAIRADWPEDWRDILAANNERAPMWLRVNTARTNVAAYRGAVGCGRPRCRASRSRGHRVTPGGANGCFEPARIRRRRRIRAGRGRATGGPVAAVH